MASSAAATGMTARLCEDLAERLGPTRFGLWFERTARLDLKADRLRVTVPTRFHADWIDRHFREDLRTAAARTSGSDLALELTVEPEAFPGLAVAAPAPVPPHLPRRRRGPSAPGQFDLRFDLDRFVVGAGNEMAFHAACAMASGAATFNPLFIHGGCGLGKTHLLQGICRRLRAAQPEARLRYVTGEQFTNEFIAAVRTNDLESFRRPYRELDLLAIDDVHFLSNKNATQAEFLATFDAIGLTGAKIVLASDEHPRQIRQFHQRLVSRLLSGMVVEVQMPDAATRLAIIRRWAQERGFDLHPAAAEALAHRCIGSVRDIEGALTRLEAITTLGLGQAPLPSNPGQRLEIGMLLISRLFGEESREHRAPARVDAILDAVAERFGLDASRLTGKSRHKRIVLARSIAAFLARRMTTRSFPEIARAMGRSNHSTIFTAVQRIDQQLASNENVCVNEAGPPVSLRYLLDTLEASIARERSATAG